MAEIALDHVSKSYAKGEYAVRDFSLTIADGEFMVFVGPSGCGKSTTLRMIAGLESITSGQLTIDGQPANALAPRDRDLAMVFQDYALYPHMSVYKNLAYPLRMHHVDREKGQAAIREAAELLDIQDLLDRKPAQLSGGQKQRVALGRAIVRQPKAFLMDEPLSNLDAKLRVSMRYEITRLHQKLGTTFIYVTHDQTEAMTMADRIVVMNQGQIQQVGTPDQIYRQPANLFVAKFIGLPQINLLARRLEAGCLQFGSGLDLAGEGGESRRPLSQLADQTLTVGIRPENLILTAGDSCTVHMVENLGSLRYVYLTLSQTGEKVVASVSDTGDYQPGDRFDLVIKQPDRLNYFDASGQRIV